MTGPPSQPSSNELGYLPQLDGVRALAVTLVVTAHLMPKDWGIALDDLEPRGFSGMDILGPSGVDIFFVLSGFLITGILLKGRQSVDSGRTHAWVVLRAFYFRRSLRIFPIYYCVIAFVLVAGIGITTTDLPWHVLYATNIRIFLSESLPGSATHLWSLAVEEQFYALWPALVLVAPRRLLSPALGCLFVAGPAFRIVGWLLGWRFAFMLLPGCVDLFALGAFLSLAFLRSAADCRRTGTLALATSAVLALGLSVLGLLAPSGAGWVLARRTLVGLLSVWLISRAATGMGGWVGGLLGSLPGRFIGKISYGIYLFHNFAPEALGRLSLLSGLTLPPAGFKFVLLCAGSVGAAAASWHFIEEPLLRLKRTGWGRLDS